MRYLVDGNNLMYALRKLDVPAGREMVCRLLGGFAQRTGRAVTVIFDGHPSRTALTRQPADVPLDVGYAFSADADDVLIEMIQADSAPRRLTVVSTDRALRKAARRRRCQSVHAESFAELLLAPPPPRRRPDPPAKRAGLPHGSAEAWLRYFGLPADTPPKPHEPDDT